MPTLVETDMQSPLDREPKFPGEIRGSGSK